MKSGFLCLIIFLLTTTSAHGGFRDGYKSPRDLLLSLHMKFEQLRPGHAGDCVNLTRRSRPTLGDQNLLTGDSAVDVPGAAFLNYWNSCIESYLNEMQMPTVPTHEQTESRQRLIRLIFEPLLAESPDLESHWTSHLFPSDPALQEKLVRHWVWWALGSDAEIQSYGRMRNPEGFRQDLLKYLRRKGSPRSLSEVSREAILILLKRDEFLLYL